MFVILILYWSCPVVECKPNLRQRSTKNIHHEQHSHRLIGHVTEYPTMHHSGIPRQDQSMIAYKISVNSCEKKTSLWWECPIDLHDQNKPELSYHKTDIKQVAIPTYNHVVTRAHIYWIEGKLTNQSVSGKMYWWYARGYNGSQSNPILNSWIPYAQKFQPTKNFFSRELATFIFDSSVSSHHRLWKHWVKVAVFE